MARGAAIDTAGGFADGLLKIKDESLYPPDPSNFAAIDEAPGSDLNNEDRMDTNTGQIISTINIDSIKTEADRYYPHIIKHNCPSKEDQLQCDDKECTTMGELYNCLSCFGTSWLCRRCILSAHRENPFHRVDFWDITKKCRVSVSLESIGLIISFKDPNGDSCRCKLTTSNSRTLEVLHLNGLHTVRYKSCTCKTSLKGYVSPEMLLTERLYPATGQRPNRAFTFEVLEEYDNMNLYGHVNIKQFLDAKLKNMNDNVG